MTFTRDKEVMVQLLHCSWATSNLWLFNCREIMHDMLRGCGVRGVCVPRKCNQECDSLANVARGSGSVFLADFVESETLLLVTSLLVARSLLSLYIGLLVWQCGRASALW